MFSTLTQGMYTPTLHRVVNTDPARSRVSIPFFFEPAFDAMIAPLPQLAAPGTRAAGAGVFAPVRYGTHLESKVLKNFEL